MPERTITIRIPDVPSPKKSPSIVSIPFLGFLFTLAFICLLVASIFMHIAITGPYAVYHPLYPDVAASTPVIGKTKSITLPTIAASANLVRINQLDPGQYNSTDEYNAWWPSACSAASMAEVINSFRDKNHRYRITDILSKEIALNEITPDLGLLRASGIDHTVAQFGFKAQWLSNPSISDMVTIGNSGHPIIIDFPPAKWDGGHILVVLGGKKIKGIDYVHLADSSRLNMQLMTYATFAKYWAGWAVIVSPK